MNRMIPFSCKQHVILTITGTKMKNRISLFVLLFLLLALPLRADELVLSNGEKHYGKVLRQSNSQLVFSRNGTIKSYSMDQVQFVRTNLPPAEEFRRRMKQAKKDGKKQQLQVCKWGKKQGLTGKVIPHLKTLADQVATRQEARTLLQKLGYRKYNQKWVSQETFYKKSGYVKYLGKWMTRTKKYRLVRKARIKKRYRTQKEHIKQQKKELRKKKKSIRKKMMETSVDIRKLDTAIGAAQKIRKKIHGGFAKIRRKLAKFEPKYLNQVKPIFKEKRKQLKEGVKKEKKLIEGRARLIRTLREKFKESFDREMSFSKHDFDRLKAVAPDKVRELKDILEKVKDPSVPRTKNMQAIKKTVDRKMKHLKQMKNHLGEIRDEIKNLKGKVSNLVEKGKKLLKKMKKKEKKANQKGNNLSSFLYGIIGRRIKSRLREGKEGLKKLKNGVNTLNNGISRISSGIPDLKFGKKQIQRVIEGEKKIKRKISKATQLYQPAGKMIKLKSAGHDPSNPQEMKAVKEMTYERTALMRAIAGAKSFYLIDDFRQADSVKELKSVFDRLRRDLRGRLVGGLNKAYRKRRELKGNLKTVNRKIKEKKLQKRFKKDFLSWLKHEKKRLRRSNCIQNTILKPRKRKLEQWKDRAVFLVNYSSPNAVPEDQQSLLPPVPDVPFQKFHQNKQDHLGSEITFRALFEKNAETDGQFVAVVHQKTARQLTSRTGKLAQDSSNNAPSSNKPSDAKQNSKNNKQSDPKQDKKQSYLMPVVISGDISPDQIVGNEIRISGEMVGTTTMKMNGREQSHLMIHAKEIRPIKPEIPSFKEAFLECRGN